MIYNLKTKDLLTMCSNLDLFDEFIKIINDEQLLLSSRIDVNNLENLIKGKRIIGKKRLKSFYKKNKAIIEVVSQKLSLSLFITDNYNLRGLPYIRSEVSYFMNNVLTNKDKIDIIIDNLKKIDNIGIDKITINDTYDFSKDRYYLEINEPNFSLIYADNLEVLPSYRNEIVYRTIYSNYLIKFNVSLKEISNYNNIIYINDLSKDLSNFPEEKDYQKLYNSLLEKRNQLSKSNLRLREAVDLSIGVEDLLNECTKLNKLVASLNEIDNKEELISLLKEIEIKICELDVLSNNSNMRLIANDTNMSEESIEEAKKYVKRIKYSSMFDMD